MRILLLSFFTIFSVTASAQTSVLDSIVVMDSLNNKPYAKSHYYYNGSVLDSVIDYRWNSTKSEYYKTLKSIFQFNGQIKSERIDYTWDTSNTSYNSSVKVKYNEVGSEIVSDSIFSFSTNQWTFSSLNTYNANGTYSNNDTTGTGGSRTVVVRNYDKYNNLTYTERKSCAVQTCNSGCILTCFSPSSYSFYDHDSRNMQIYELSRYEDPSGKYHTSRWHGPEYYYQQVTNIKSSELVNIILYPNPAENSISIELSNNEINNIIVRNLSGTVLIESTGKSNLSINIENLPKGVYIVEIQTKEGSVFKKFVKK